MKFLHQEGVMLGERKWMFVKRLKYFTRSFRKTRSCFLQAGRATHNTGNSLEKEAKGKTETEHRSVVGKSRRPPWPQVAPASPAGPCFRGRNACTMIPDPRRKKKPICGRIRYGTPCEWMRRALQREILEFANSTNSFRLFGIIREREVQLCEARNSSCLSGCVCFPNARYSKERLEFRQISNVKFLWFKQDLLLLLPSSTELLN